MNKRINQLSIAAVIIFIIAEFGVGIYKPLWIDEIVTVWQFKAFSATQLIEKFFLGFDTHPPLYFLCASIFTSIFGINEFVLKLFSFLLSLGSVIAIIDIIKKLGLKKELSFTLLVLSTTYFFSNFLLTEIRPYSMFFLLSLLVLRDLIKILQLQKFNHLAIRIIIYGLFIYTHYYAAVYLSIVAVLLWFSKERHFKIYLPIFVSFVLFIPWLFAIINQREVFQNLTWHFLPDAHEIILYPISFFRYTSIIILPLIVIGLFIFRSKAGIPIRYLFLALLIFPYINILLFLVGVEIYSYKYLIPSFAVCVILIPFASEIYSKKYIRIGLTVVLILFGAARIINYFHWSVNIHERITSEISFTDMPIVCESPLDFAQLKYYAEKDSMADIIYPLKVEGQMSRKKKFENLWLNILSQKFKISGIQGFDSLLEQHKQFYFIEPENQKISDYHWSLNYEINDIENSRVKIVSLIKN